MLFYCKLTKALLSYGFKLNPYELCVVNKMRGRVTTRFDVDMVGSMIL